MVCYLVKLSAIARLSQALASKLLEEAAEDDSISLMDMVTLTDAVERLFFDPLDDTDLFSL